MDSGSKGIPKECAKGTSHLSIMNPIACQNGERTDLSVHAHSSAAESEIYKTISQQRWRDLYAKYHGIDGISDISNMKYSEMRNLDENWNWENANLAASRTK